MKVKIFTGSEGIVLSTKVNDWILSVNIDVIDIKYSTAYNDRYNSIHYSAMIMYRDKQNTLTELKNME